MLEVPVPATEKTLVAAGGRGAAGHRCDPSAE